VAWQGLPFPSTVVAGREICRLTLLGELYVFGSPSSLLVRADLVRGDRDFYDDNPFLTLYADQEACFRVLKDCDFGFVHQILTFTREHPESITSSRARTWLNSHRIAKLMILTRYGQDYLAPMEYRNLLEAHIDRYYRFLGRCLPRFRDEEFRHYHLNALSHLGYSLERFRLVRAFGLEAMRTIFRMLGARLKRL
jgi:hypothetical protein